MTDMIELDRLPLLPRDADGPVFAEAWQAQAFAMTIELSRQDRFTWSEWATALAAEITAAQARGDADLGDTYYHHWLAALERLVAAKECSARAISPRASKPGGKRPSIPSSASRSSYDASRS